jgi:hypothetical protein
MRLLYLFSRLHRNNQDRHKIYSLSSTLAPENALYPFNFIETFLFFSTSNVSFSTSDFDCNFEKNYV